MKEQIPEILYHYCSVDTFVKIVQNRTLRLSEIAKSNDSMECRWLEKVLLPSMIHNRINLSVPEENDDTARLEEEIISSIVEIFNLPYGKQGEILENKLVLAFCLSENPDLLSQWRGYASDGSGISIGIDKSFLDEFSNLTIQASMDFKKVIYERTEQEKEVEPDLDKYVKQFILLTMSPDSKPDSDELKRFFNSLAPFAYNMMLRSVYIKNPAFSEEKEWRLYASFINVNGAERLKAETRGVRKLEWFSDISAISRNERLIYYFDLHLDRVDRELSKLPYIKSIYLGPKCRLTERDIRLLMETNNWDISNLEIRKSSATYI